MTEPGTREGERPAREMDLDRLLHMYADQKAEMEHQRRRGFQIFIGTNIFLAVVVWAVMSRSALEAGFGVYEVLFLAMILVGVVFLTLFSILWQYSHDEYAAGHQRILVRLQVALGYYEAAPDGASWYPESWKEWGRQEYSAQELLGRPGHVLRRLVRPSKLSATIILAAIAVATILLRILQAQMMAG